MSASAGKSKPKRVISVEEIIARDQASAASISSSHSSTDTKLAPPIATKPKRVISVEELIAEAEIDDMIDEMPHGVVCICLFPKY